MNSTPNGPDMLALSAQRYWFKPMAIYFNALQLRAYQAAGMRLNSPVLDVGCSDGGFGVLLCEAMGRPEELLGIDPLQIALDSAGEEARSLYREMHCASATSLPFPDKSFNTIVANASLFAIHPSLDKAVAEFHRVLQPGGVLYATVCTDQYDDHYWLTRLLNRMGCARLARRYADGMNARMMQAHMFSPQQWQDQLVQGGFTIRQCVGFLSLKDTPFWSFLAWTPWRVNGVLWYLSSSAWRARVAGLYTQLFRKRFESSPPLLPAETCGYIFLEAVKS